MLDEVDFPNHALKLSPQMAVAVRAAAAAGSVVRAGAGKITAIEHKGVGDLVSQVDREADRVACDLLRSASDLAILSEELNSTAGLADDMWIVDPLDASSAFLSNAGPQYPAVLIAQRRAGEIVLGVVYFPLAGDWYYAERGRGAWRNGHRLVCQPSDALKDVWVEMNHYGNARYETPFFSQLRDRLRGEAGARLVTANVPNSGVAMRIAAGNSSLQAAVHDNNPQSVKQGSWDIAAPQVILEEAGGVFVNPQGERTDPFRCEPIIVARSRELAEAIAELVHVPASHT